MALAQQCESRIGILRVAGDLSLSSDKLKMRLLRIDGVLQSDVNCYAGKIYIEYDPSRVSLDELRSLVEVTTLQFGGSKVIPVGER